MPDTQLRNAWSLLAIQGMLYRQPFYTLFSMLQKIGMDTKQSKNVCERYFRF